MQDFVTRYDFPFQLLQATVSSKMLLNPKVLLCICLTFIPFNNGQIRTWMDEAIANRFGDGMIEYKPQLQLQPESAGALNNDYVLRELNKNYRFTLIATTVFGQCE